MPEYDLGTARGKVVVDFDGSGTSEAGEAIKGIGDNSQTASKKGGAAFSGLKLKTLGYVAAAIAAVKQTLNIGKAIVGGGFSRLTGIENAKAKMEGLGFSTKQVDQIMDNALKSVKGTSFALQDAAGLAAMAVAAGIKPGKQLQGQLDLVSNSAAAMGVPLQEVGGIFQNVWTSGKVSMDQINQVMYRGIPILQILAKSYGVSTDKMQQMVTDGKVGIDGFTKAMQKGVGNVAFTMGGTLTSTIDNSKAALARLGAAGLAPIMPYLKSFFNGLINVADALTAKLTPVMKTLVPILADGLAGALKVVGSGLSSAYKWIQQNWQIVGPFAVALATFATAFVLVTSAIKAYNIATKIAAAVSKAFSASLLTNPVFLIIAAIVALVAGLVYFFTQTKLGKAIWAGFINWLKSAWQAVVSFFTASFDVIKSVLTNIASFFSTVWNAIVNTVTTVINAIATFINSWITATQTAWNTFWTAIGDFLSSIFTAIGNTINTWLTAISTIWNAAWNGIMAVLQPIFDVIATIISTYITIWKDIFLIFAAVLVTIWNAIKAAAVAVWNAIMSFITPIVKAIASFIQSTIQGIQKVWTTVWNAIKDFFTALWTAIVKFLEPIIKSIADFIKSTTDAIKTAWNNVWGAIKSFFVDQWNAMVKFYTPIVQGIYDFINGTIKNIKSVWNTVWGAIKSYFTGLWTAMVNYYTPIVKGIYTFIHDTIQNIKTTWNNIWGAIKSFFTGIWDTMVGKVKDAIGKVISTVTGIKDKILGALKGAASWLYNVGKNIIQGAINGIGDMVGKVKDKITGLFKGAVGWAKGVLGIHSPSKVFADIGENTVKGMMKGIDRLKPKLDSQMKDLGGDVSATVKANVNSKQFDTAEEAAAASSAVDNSSSSSRTLVYNKYGSDGLDSEEELFDAMRIGEVVVPGW